MGEQNGRSRLILKVRDTRDLQDWLTGQVYPALFRRLPDAFPEFGWEDRDGRYEASAWPSGFPYTVNDQRPERLMVYPDRPWWIKVHGHEGVRWLDYVNNGRKPTGQEFLQACRDLGDRAGVPFPEDARSEEEVQESLVRDERREFLEALSQLSELALWSETRRGKAAVAYLAQRGLPEDKAREFRLGLAPTSGKAAAAWLRERDWSAEAIGRHLPLWWKMAGYIVVPWLDEHGRPLTIYGRWPGEPPLMKDHPGWRYKRDKLLKAWEGNGKAAPWQEPRLPKTYALPGGNSKCSPLYLDRALAAGHREVVVVEGVFDALALQAKGEKRAVASVAAQLAGEQVKTLVRCGVQRAVICGDPDGGGDAGTTRNVICLGKAGISPYVVERLPDGLDPDEFLHRDGLDAWRQRVRGARHGYRQLAELAFRQHAAEYGERLDGDDYWTDALIKRVRRVALELNGGREDELRHLYRTASELSGVREDDFRPRPMEAGAPGPGKPAGDGPQATGGEAAGEYRFCALGSAEFFAADFGARFLVERLLVADQPGVCGGVKKGMKTTLLADLTVSLSTGTSFLGRFKVYRRTPVLFVSAESGEATIQATARRICAARGVEPRSLEGWCWWSFRLPQFGSPEQMSVFRAGLATLPLKGVAVLDPLYLALLAGMDPRAVQAGNLYQIGPLLLRVARACLDLGWTPLLAHHSTKHGKHEALDLDDLAMAGIAEFARQWLLLSRREAYRDGTGSHRLWMRAGGSVGHGGLWALDIEEGCVGADEETGRVRFDSRRWEVTVTPASESIRCEREGREDERRENESRQVREDGGRLLLAVDAIAKDTGAEDGWVNYTKVRAESHLNTERMTRALASLVRERVVEEGEVKVCIGHGKRQSRTCRALRRFHRDNGRCPDES